MMMYVAAAAFLTLIVCGIHVAHANENENAGMNTYMNDEYRVVTLH